MDTPPAKSHNVTRRTVAKGIAWSVPVVALASAAPMAAASTPGFDLDVSFATAVTIDVRLGPLSLLRVSLAPQLTITNLGPEPSPQTTGVVTIPSTIAAAIETNEIANVTIGGTGPTRTLTIGPLPAGGSATIGFGLLRGALNIGLLGSYTMSASIAAGDINSGNNTDSTTIGISIL